MKTSKEVVLALLEAEGSQTFESILHECRNQANPKLDIKELKIVLNEMTSAREIFTDGPEFSTDAADFEPNQLIHFSEYLALTS